MTDGIDCALDCTKKAAWIASTQKQGILGAPMECGDLSPL